MSDQTTADSDQRAGQRLIAEVIKQVQEDYQRGGLALNTKTVIGKRPDDADTNAVYVRVDVEFWTLKDDPFNQ